MVIKLPGKAFSGVKAQAPRNYGRANKYMPVQLELDHTVAKAGAQYLEAIAVDGFDIHYWHRCTEGKFCTCSNTSGIKHSMDAPTSSPTSDIEDDSGGIEITVRNNRDILQRNKVETTKAFGIEIGKIPNGEESRTDVNTDFSESWTELERLADEDAIQRMNPDSSILFGLETAQCGICFGAGYINAYNLNNGKRDILDTSADIIDQKGFTINRANKPYTFDAPIDKTLYVDFIYETPAFFERCWSVQLRNNTSVATNMVLKFKIQGTNDAFQTLTADALNQLNGSSHRLIIRACPQTTKLEGLVNFTHVELVWQFAPWPKAQMPGISEATNFGIWDTIMSSEMTLPPTISAVDKEDLIFETKHNKLWKITDYSDFKTAKQQICGWSVTTRLVQTYEQLSLLQLITVPYFELAYGRLEAIQGAFMKSNDTL